MEFFTIVLVLLILGFFFGTLKTVSQGTVAVVTMFGKYRRIMLPGLNIKIPFLETIHKRISIQNRSADLEFQAITQDQANVYFKAMILYSVLNQSEEVIKNVAFKFIDEKNFMQALIRTVEGTVRSFVATKKQVEILALRNEIVAEVKHHLDTSLESWGYHLIDLQINDITFDKAIIESMAKVVASQNLKAAAENEGQALLITKTKQAEAEGNAIKISAEAERQAMQMRGEGVTLFRESAARGIRDSAKELQEAGLDASMIMFQMWTETIKHFAEFGKGNVIFMDGSSEGMERTMKQMMALQVQNKK
ncbi:MAG: SPFH domain-containing protein [Candidatus Kapabacteria bacterium]|nr:SPFH domain-containing protein [Candidatus Kapabacteria bacterium]MBX7154195.1 SPFH domain-containing protein [Bacteroidota bacterium]